MFCRTLLIACCEDRQLILGENRIPLIEQMALARSRGPGWGHSSKPRIKSLLPKVFESNQNLSRASTSLPHRLSYTIDAAGPANQGSLARLPSAGTKIYFKAM